MTPRTMMDMQPTGSKQRKTLERVFAQPTPNDVLWSDIESLLTHLGCTIKYLGGSRVRFAKGSERHFAHRPHPSNQTPSLTIKGIRNFLARIGAEP